MPPKWRLGERESTRLTTVTIHLYAGAYLSSHHLKDETTMQVPTSWRRMCIGDYQLPQGLSRKEWKELKETFIYIHNYIITHTCTHACTLTHRHTHTLLDVIIPLYFSPLHSHSSICSPGCVWWDHWSTTRLHHVTNTHGVHSVSAACQWPDSWHVLPANHYRSLWTRYVLVRARHYTMHVLTLLANNMGVPFCWHVLS